MSSRPRLILLAAIAAALLLVPVAQAAAIPTVTVTIAGTGSGEVSSVGGYFGIGIWEGFPPIACSGPPATGTCVSEMTAEEEGGTEGVALTAHPAPGSTFAGWTIEEGTPLNSECPGFEATSCLVGGPEGAAPNAKVKATFDAALPEFILTVTKSGTGTGTITSSPPGSNAAAPARLDSKKAKQSPSTTAATLALNSSNGPAPAPALATAK